MKKSKVFLLGSTVLLAMGSLTMSACGLTELFGSSDDDDSSDSSSLDDDDSDYSISDEELTDDMVRGKDTSFTVSINGLQSYYSSTESIDWTQVSLTLTYDDLTVVTLENVEFDVDARSSDDTDFVLYTDGLYEISTTGTMKEDTYSLSYRIYLEEEYTDEEGARQTQLAMYRGTPVNQSSIVITDYPSQVYRVYSFSAPTLQETYEKNIAESVDSEGGSENEDKFYEEPEYYEVGDDNPFTYKPRLIWMNRQTGVLENPDSFNVDFSVYHYNGATDTFTKLDLDNNEYVTRNGFDFQFTDGGLCIDEVFRITVSLVDFTTDMTNNPLPTYSFTVKVEDGWNVYDELDLGRMNLVSDEFDDDWLDASYNSGGNNQYRNTGMWSNREMNYEAKGRAFFENGTPEGYHIYANHYWVDEYGNDITDESGFLCTDLNDKPDDAYHVVYSLTRGSYNYTNLTNRTSSISGTNDYFAYRVKLDEYWYNFLSEKGKIDLHQVNGVFLHTDLKITEDCIPPEFLVTSEEAYQLGPDSADGLSAWGEYVAAALTPLLKVSSDGTAYEYDDMDGSIRDRSYLYLHHMEDDFTLNGNLFTIDASKLKWCMNNVFLPSMNFYYTEETEFAIQSNACFMAFDYNREATHPDYNTATDGLYTKDRPEATVKNLRYSGNSRNYTEAEDASNVRSGRLITNAEFASGCLSFIQSESVQTNVDNVICKDANIAFFGARTHTNDELFCFDINHTKVYDCYTTAFYLWCSGNTKVENSEFKRYGGPFSICISTYQGSNSMAGNVYYYQHDYTSVEYYVNSSGKLYNKDTGYTYKPGTKSDGSDDWSVNNGGDRTLNHGSTVVWDSTMILGDNVTVESYVGGTESWFVLNNATSVVTLVKGYDYLLNKAGKTMIASNDPDDDNYGKFNLKGLFMDSTYILSGSYEIHGSYVSDQDNVWENGYEINAGADTDMQNYINKYARWAPYVTGTTEVGHYEGGINIGNANIGGTWVVDGYENTYSDEEFATPIFFTNSGKAFGFPETEDMVSMADPVGDNAVLYDLEEYDKNNTKVEAQFDETDTEVFMVIPLQVDMDGIEVNLSELLLDMLGLGSLASGNLGSLVMQIVDGICESLGIDDPEHCNLGDLMRLDIDLSTYASIAKILGVTLPESITVGMGDTLIGVVMDLYDYQS